MLRKLRDAVGRLKHRYGHRRPLSMAQDGSKLMDRLVKENPSFHLTGGTPTNWSVHRDTLRFIYRLLEPGFATLETGCGQTTVVFAIAGTKHTCVMPNEGEARRVGDYCNKLGLSNDVTFVIESSDVALPCNNRMPSNLDFVLIDGAHAFPAPIIDWHYTAGRLGIGRVLAVDDYKMPSVRILHDFLNAEEEWELLEIVQNTSFFRKLRAPKALVDWSGQRINAAFPGH